MPRDLFGDVTRPSISIGNQKWYTVPVSLLSHFAIVLAVVLIPLLAPGLLPKVAADTLPPVFIMPIVPQPPPLPAITKPLQHVENPNAAPTEAPNEIAPEKPLPEWREPTTPGIIDGTITESNSRALVEPPPPPAPPQPLRVGGIIRTPQKTRHVDPVYPQMAILSRTQGIVIIEATIGADGQTMNARVLRSIPLLDQAALDAVRQWQHSPSLLNGVPVPVIMTVTVVFTLSK